MQSYELTSNIKRVCSMVEKKQLSIEIAGIRFLIRYHIGYCITQFIDKDIKEKLIIPLDTMQQTNPLEFCNAVREETMAYYATLKNINQLNDFPSVLSELFNSILDPLLNGVQSNQSINNRDFTTISIRFYSNGVVRSFQESLRITVISIFFSSSFSPTSLNHSSSLSFLDLSLFL